LKAKAPRRAGGGVDMRHGPTYGNDSAANDSAADMPPTEGKRGPVTIRKGAAWQSG